MVKVTVITVVYGNRWPLLRQVAEQCLADRKVTTFVIVDNGCTTPEEMDVYARKYGERIAILRQEKNVGYSGAISKGLEYARGTDCDYVFVLDDDSVPEEHAIDYFLDTLKLFPNNKVILAGNRIDVPGNPLIFNRKPLALTKTKGTLFDVFNLKAIVNLLSIVLRRSRVSDYPFIPVVPLEAFVTGASFLPIEVVRTAPLPDASLFIYGEDLEYSWRILRMGYSCYAVARPIIRDIDLTFQPSEGSHITGLFDSETPAYKVYFRMRNAVIISRRNTLQWQLTLVLNVVVWFVGVCLIGLIKTGPTRTYFGRVRLIARALLTGFFPSIAFPSSVKKPT